MNIAISGINSISCSAISDKCCWKRSPVCFVGIQFPFSSKKPTNCVSAVPAGTAEHDFGMRMLLMQRSQAVCHDLFSIQSFNDFSGSMPNILRNPAPVVMHHGAVTDHSHIAAVWVNSDDIVSQQSGTKSARGKTGYDQFFRIWNKLPHFFQ